MDSAKRRSSRTAAYLLAALVVFAPLAHGSVSGWTIGAALAVSAAAAVLATRAAEARASLSVLALSLAALGAALQLVPLPPFVHRLSPAARQLFVSLLGPLGDYPSWRPLSLDPAATGLELAKACAAALAAYAASTLGRRGRRACARALASAGALAAATGLAAAAFGRPLFEPRLVFANPNHLGGFLAFTSWIALALALRSDGRARLLWAASFLVGVAGLGFTLSRGALGAFAVGGVVFSLLLLRTGRSPSRVRHAALGAALCAALVAASALTSERALDRMGARLSLRPDARPRLWNEAAALMRDFPLTGVGRGAFGPVFASYRLDPEPRATFTHAESQPLQIVIELGLPLGVLVLAGIAWAWFSGARAKDLGLVEAGALAGTAALLAHDVVDFPLDLAGALVPFAVALALLSRTQPSIRARSGPRALALAAAFLAGAAGLLVHARHDADRDARSVAAAGSPSDVVASARVALRWHPADYLPPAIAGSRLAGMGRCREALGWLSRAMVLGPANPAPHRVAARCLARAGDPAAKQEFRLAFSLGDEEALADALALFPDPERARDLVPDTPGGLVALGAALAASTPGAAAAVLEEAWTSYRDRRAIAQLPRALLDAGEASRALDAARELEQQQPTPAAFALQAEALRALGREEQALAELRRGAAAHPGAAALLLPLGQAELARRHFGLARGILERIVPTGPAEAADKHLTIALTYAGQRRHVAAAAEARRAHDAFPENGGALLAEHDYLVAAGRHGEAKALVERMRGRVPARDLAERLDRIEGAARPALDGP